MNIERLKEVFGYLEHGALYYRIKMGHCLPGTIAGSVSGKGYRKVGIDGKRLQEHRVIFAIHHGYMPDHVDHINGLKNDNRICNLRSATNAQNHWNTGLRSTNKSGVKGVHWNKQINKWVAACRANGRIHRVGSFADINDAASAIEAYRQRVHGDFAKHAAAHGIGTQGGE